MLTHSPTEVKEIVPVDLPAPRDQIETKELPEFAQLRAHVYRLIKRERPRSPARSRRAASFRIVELVRLRHFATTSGRA